MKSFSSFFFVSRKKLLRIGRYGITGSLVSRDIFIKTFLYKKGFLFSAFKTYESLLYEKEAFNLTKTVFIYQHLRKYSISLPVLLV